MDAVALENEAKSHPAAVLARGDELVAASGDDAERADVLRVLGIAARIDRDLAASQQFLDEALSIARRLDAPSLGRILLSSAATLAYEGDNTGALDQLAEAETLVTGLDRALLHSHRAGILHRMDRVDEALVDYGRALDDFHGNSDETWAADARMNRAILYADAGRVVEARREVETALDTYRRADSWSGIADATHNLGFVAVRSGDIPAALGHLDDAEVAYRRAGLPHAAVPPARCEALMAAGLFRRAFDEAMESADRYREAGNTLEEAQALLLATRAANLSGGSRRAFELGHRAASMFDAQLRSGWAAAARFETLLARFGLGGDDLSGHTDAADVATTLEQARFRSIAGRAHLLAARFADRGGQHEPVAHHLRRAWALLRSGPLEHRVEYWTTCAIHRQRRGDERGAATAISAGFRTFERLQDSFASLELRAHASSHLRNVADLALRRAVATQRPAAVSDAIERGRSRALVLPDVGTGDDAHLHTLLAQLRAARAVVDRSGFDRGASAADLEAVQDVQRRIEAHVGRAGRVTAQRRDHDLDRARADVQFVQLAADGDDVVAVCRSRRRRFVHVGSLDEIQLIANAVQYGLDEAAAGGAADAAAQERLDALLRPVLGGVVPNRPLVLAPPPELFDVAWSALPSLAEVEVEIAPSVRVWSEVAGRPRRHLRRAAVVAGSDVDGAQPEIDAVRDAWPRHDAPLQPNVQDVADALDGADVGHLVAHGRFEPDNPLFSSLRFADGDLIFHDLAGIERFPAVVMLSSCSGALHATSGHDVLGIGSGLLALGAKCVISASGFVPDNAASAAVAGLVHAGLATGMSPAAALRRARLADDDTARTVASLFTAYGGW